MLMAHGSVRSTTTSSARAVPAAPNKHSTMMNLTTPPCWSCSLSRYSGGGRGGGSFAGNAEEDPHPTLPRSTGRGGRGFVRQLNPLRETTGDRGLSAAALRLRHDHSGIREDLPRLPRFLARVAQHQSGRAVPGEVDVHPPVGGVFHGADPSQVDQAVSDPDEGVHGFVPPLGCWST